MVILDEAYIRSNIDSTKNCETYHFLGWKIIC